MQVGPESLALGQIVLFQPVRLAVEQPPLDFWREVHAGETRPREGLQRRLARADRWRKVARGERGDEPRLVGEQIEDGEEEDAVAGHEPSESLSRARLVRDQGQEEGHQDQSLESVAAGELPHPMGETRVCLLASKGEDAEGRNGHRSACENEPPEAPPRRGGFRQAAFKAQCGEGGDEEAREEEALDRIAPQSQGGEQAPGRGVDESGLARSEQEAEDGRDGQ